MSAIGKTEIGSLNLKSMVGSDQSPTDFSVRTAGVQCLNVPGAHGDLVPTHPDFRIATPGRIFRETFWRLKKQTTGFFFHVKGTKQWKETFDVSIFAVSWANFGSSPPAFQGRQVSSSLAGTRLHGGFGWSSWQTPGSQKCVVSGLLPHLTRKLTGSMVNWIH